LFSLTLPTLRLYSRKQFPDRDRKNYRKKYDTTITADWDYIQKKQFPPRLSGAFATNR